MLAADADESTSTLLDLLGWRHARTSPKGLPFETKFRVMGCTIDLGRLNRGLVTLENNWEQLVCERLICQIELYAMVALRWMLKDTLVNRRTTWWVDNEAARFSVIKGQSPSPVMRWLVREFYNFEVEAPTFSWVERVPSYSNIADGPSRAKPEEAMQLLGISHCSTFEHPPELVACLLNA